MIVFGKNDKVENLGILEKEEAEAYICFLNVERYRHKLGIKEAREIISSLRGYIPNTLFNKAYKKFYNSAIRRHKEDIEAIDVLVETVKFRYGI